MNGPRTVSRVIAVAAAIVLQGCYTAPPTPVTVPGRSLQERFEQSWQAARGAFGDTNVRLTREDRAGGTLRGEQGSSNVVITLVPQADESIQVGFSVTGGEAVHDKNLSDLLAHAYQRRMGR